MTSCRGHTFVSSPNSLKGTGYGTLKGKNLKSKAAVSNWKSMRMSCRPHAMLRQAPNFHPWLLSWLCNMQHLADGRVTLALPKDGQPLSPARREAWQRPRVGVPLCFHLCIMATRREQPHACMQPRMK